MHKGVDIIIVFIFVLLTIFAWFFITKHQTNKQKCKSLGGVYIESQCIKKEIIKLY